MESRIDWFRNIKNKQQYSLICFDIVDFYPSISHRLLRRALNFASYFYHIKREEKDIIMYAKISFIIHKDQAWERNGASHFNVTMGSDDGAESFGLLGSFILPLLPSELEQNMTIHLQWPSHNKQHTKNNRAH